MSQHTSLTQHTLRLPSALPAGTNPLPYPDAMLEAPFELGADVPAELQQNSRVGHPRSMHPNLMQDGYSRRRTAQDFATFVLDNGLLRATFIPEIGGRLWSLTDLHSGRDLLHVNQVMQPANFALRNAWVAGGVEWNIGSKGHAAHTLSPLHAAEVRGPDGAPMLRMWELDRLRNVVFQVDAWLPAGARGLRVYVRIVNANSRAVPMYWWSNAAVPQGRDVRVLTPARTAFATGYDRTVREVPVPVAEGLDHTWPTSLPRSADYFYDVGGQEAPWIAAVDGSGHGLAHVSTPRLRGRKLFCWGHGPGGRRWQEWLSPAGGEYLEIQAGLATTQFEHLMMPADATWDWVEIYGDVDADAAQAHSSDWSAATAHVDQRVRVLAGPEELDAALAAARECADAAPMRILARASGWGRLERSARAVRGERWPGAGTPFGEDTLGAEQQPWLSLLDNGGRDPFAGADPQVAPVSYVTGEFWRERLQALAPGWLRDYHLGVLAQAREELARAREWFASSVRLRPSAWALRGQARVVAEEGEPRAAARLLTAALELAPDQPELVLEAIEAALAAELPEEALALIDAAPPEVAAGGRGRLLAGTAALRVGNRSRAEAVLAADVEIPDLREGDRSLSDLWQEVFPGEPVPAHYDFRMA